MPEIIPCPSCQRKLRLPDGAEVAEALCPACGARFAVRAASPEPPPMAEAVPVGPAEEAPRPAYPPAPQRRPGPRPTDLTRPRRPRRRATCAVVGLLFVLAVLLIGGGLLVALIVSEKGRARRDAFAESDEQRRQQLRAAFAGQAPPPPGEQARQLNALFEELGAAFRDRDERRLMGLFDLDRMFDEMAAQPTFPAAFRRDRRSFITGLRLGLGRSLAQQGELIAWNGFEVKNVKDLGQGDAVVIVRHRAVSGATLKMRWWVTRAPAGWKVYDYEDLDVGLRVATAAGAFAQQGLGNVEEVKRGVTAIREAALALVANDADTAERKLRAVAAVRLPGPVDAVRLLQVGLVHLHRNQFQEALDAFKRARGRHPDMPVLDFAEGLAHNGLGHWEEGLKRLQKYRDLLGEDDILCYHLGESLRGVRRFPDAAASYRKALDLNPKYADAFLGLLRALGTGDRRDDVPARFARLDDHRENFRTCAEDCADDQDGVAIEQLVGAMRKIDPEDPAVDYYLALVRAWAGRADEAVKLFRSALRKGPGEKERADYQQGFLKAMLKGRKPLEAYAAAPDGREAFRTLAAALAKGYDDEPLRELVAAHAKRHADDPLLPFYRGEVFVREERFARAEKAFAAGMAKPPDAPTLDGFRSSRVLARFHTAGALPAYRDIGPRKETFAQLASLCYSEHKDRDLGALLDAHARAQTDDPEVGRYRYRLKLRQGKVAEAVALFRAGLERQAQPPQRQRWAAVFLSDMADAGHAVEGYLAAPDGRQAFRTLVGELQEENNHDGLHLLLAAHRARHPDDPWLVYQGAALRQEEKAWGEAAREFAEWWQAVPADRRGPYHWPYVYALYKAGRAMEAYQSVPPRDQTFAQLAGLLLEDKKGQELEALIAAHRAHAADSPALLYWSARSKVLAKKPEEAVALLRRAYEKQTEAWQKAHYVSMFVRDMAAAGKGLESYRAAPDKGAAFEAPAAFWAGKKAAPEMERLLAEHRPGHEADGTYLRYSGELCLLRGDAASAARQFAAALAKVTPQQQYLARQGLVRARVRAGQAAAAYRELGPGRHTFEEVAQVCSAEKNAGQLEALISAYRQERPEADVAEWELELKWLRQDYAEALRLLADDPEGLFDRPSFRWKRDSYRVRALVKLRRADEAVRAAEAVVHERHGDPVLLVLARAARDGAPGALAALAELKPGRPRPEACYRDPDLGPLLRSEPFRAFRDKYPPPPTPQAEPAE